MKREPFMARVRRMPIADNQMTYNERSEVVSAQIGTNQFAHAYDYIGNQTLFAANSLTNTYTHNALNQVTTSLCALCASA